MRTSWRGRRITQVIQSCGIAQEAQDRSSDSICRNRSCSFLTTRESRSFFTLPTVEGNFLSVKDVYFDDAPSAKIPRILASTQSDSPSHSRRSTRVERASRLVQSGSEELRPSGKSDNPRSSKNQLAIDELVSAIEEQSS